MKENRVVPIEEPAHHGIKATSLSFSLMSLTKGAPTIRQRDTKDKKTNLIAIALSNPPCEVPRPPHSHAPSTMSDDYDEIDALPPSPPPAFLLQRPPLLQPASSLYKQRSWSPDAYRDEAWLRRKGNWKNRRTRSVTDEDVDELKACIELGFGFESSPEVELDQRLSDTLPALELYFAVNKTYNNSLLSKPPSSAAAAAAAVATPPSSSAASDDCDSTPSSHGSPHTTIFSSGDNPQTVKTRLRQWAQVVACAVRQSSG